jgi:PAS domain S-box-containing protein
VAERPHLTEEEKPISAGVRTIASLPEASLLPVICAVGQLHELVALLGSRSGEVLWVSEGLAALCGASSFGKQHWLEALARPTGDGLRARLARTGRVSNERVALRSCAGRELAARVSVSQLGAEAGCDATVAIFRLEDRDEVEREFHQRVETLSAILDGSPDGVAVIDRNRFIGWANPALAEMTGYPVEELLDQPLAMLLRSQADLERIAGGLEHGPHAWSDEFEARRRDGRSLVVSVSLRRLTLPDGSELGAVAYVRDVTEERRIEQELARRAEELQHWVNAVSHDLRSPLVAVLGFARLLREDYGEQLDAQGLRFLRRIEEAGRTMESLVHDLLDFARIGRSEPKCVHVDPREVLLQLQAELKPRLEEAQVTLALPEEPPLLWCDRTQLYQVLSNLVGNALDHMGPASDPTIEVEISEGSGLQQLVVRDHGRGVDPADHERIFEIFQTRGSTRGGKRGTGIGLAVVRKIAEAHGGSAWVESEPGAGAAFHVTFRVA